MYIYKCTHHLSKSYQVNSKLSFNFELRKGEGCIIFFLKILFLFFFFNSSFFLDPVNGQRYKLFQQTIRHGTTNYPLSLLQLTGQMWLLWITTTGIKIILTIFIPIYGHTIMYIVYCMMNKMKFIDEYTKYCIHIQMI